MQIFTGRLFLRSEEAFEGGRRGSFAVHRPRVYAVQLLGVEHIGCVLKTLPSVWLGRGQSCLRLIMSSRDFKQSFQVVPDGFGVAYMTGYDGEYSKSC
jgi:hypothetical protein